MTMRRIGGGLLSFAWYPVSFRSGSWRASTILMAWFALALAASFVMGRTLPSLLSRDEPSQAGSPSGQIGDVGLNLAELDSTANAAPFSDATQARLESTTLTEIRQQMGYVLGVSNSPDQVWALQRVARSASGYVYLFYRGQVGGTSSEFQLVYPNQLLADDEIARRSPGSRYQRYVNGGEVEVIEGGYACRVESCDPTDPAIEWDRSLAWAAFFEVPGGPLGSPQLTASVRTHHPSDWASVDDFLDLVSGVHVAY